jgi:hypothetical protein
MHVHGEVESHVRRCTGRHRINANHEFPVRDVDQRVTLGRVPMAHPHFSRQRTEPQRLMIFKCVRRRGPVRIAHLAQEFCRAVLRHYLDSRPAFGGQFRPRQCDRRARAYTPAQQLVRWLFPKQRLRCARRGKRRRSATGQPILLRSNAALFACKTRTQFGVKFVRCSTGWPSKVARLFFGATTSAHPSSSAEGATASRTTLCSAASPLLRTAAPRTRPRFARASGEGERKLRAGKTMFQA